MFKLTEALEAIRDKPEFSVKEREYGTVIDYTVTMKDAFKGKTARETEILINLRGVIFNKDGDIIRLPYHKFHNLGENEDYLPEKFNLNDSHIIQRKLDGSLIAAFPIENSMGGITTFRLGTRAGITDVSLKAEKLMADWRIRNDGKFTRYFNFIDRMLSLGITPLFEFISREQRIVIDYPEPNLVLTGLRFIETGTYVFNLSEVESDGIDIVDHISPRMELLELSKFIRDLKGDEGIVLKFYDGRMVKIKSDEYCLQHKALDGLRFEKDVLALVLTGKLDDVLPLVSDDMKSRLLKYSESVLGRLRECTNEMNLQFIQYITQAEGKKEFAALVKGSRFKGGLFKLYDHRDYRLSDMILKTATSSSGVEEVRDLIGTPWSEIK